MENHPIPQDVTGFQFKLIGDMTVKQFAYIAVGSISAMIFFYLPLPFLVKIPLCILFALSGLGLAFAPVEGRPADLMASYFLKALLTPNQYAYHKVGGKISLFTIPTSLHSQPTTATSQGASLHLPNDVDKSQKLQQYLQTIHHRGTSAMDKREEVLLNNILTPTPLPVQNSGRPMLTMTPMKPLPTDTPHKVDAPLSPKEMEEQEANLSLEAASIKYELDEAKNQEAKERDQVKQPTVHEHVMTLEKKLQVLLAQKEELELELRALKAGSTPTTATQTSTPPHQETKTSTQPTEQVAQAVTQHLTPPKQPAPEVVPIAKPATPTPTQAPTVRKIPADMAKSVGLPHMPDVPNLIVGIVKDPRGNVLPNVLVEVKDRDGTPARAFRTNSLGQFASATPLSPGSYTIEFEDPKGQHKFDVVEINPHGEIMLPLEIISHDEREDLRKALFN